MTDSKSLLKGLTLVLAACSLAACGGARDLSDPNAPPSVTSEAPAEGDPGAGGAPVAVEGAPVEGAPVEGAPVEAAPVEAAPVEAAPVEAAPVEAPPPVEVAPVVAPVAANPEDGKECFVTGKAQVKFRIDSSHTAKVTGVAMPGAQMKCFEIKQKWYRVKMVDGSAEGYLPKNLVGFPK